MSWDYFQSLYPGQTSDMPAMNFGSSNLSWDQSFPSMSGSNSLSFGGSPNFMGGAASIAAPVKRGWFDSHDPITGVKTGQGYGGTVLGVGQGLMNAYLGLKQYGLMKDQFAEAKKQFGLNYDAQMRTTNAAMADRQKSALAFHEGKGMPVDEYMAKYGIQPRS